jgi:hypothetical protein
MTRKSIVFAIVLLVTLSLSSQAQNPCQAETSWLDAAPSLFARPAGSSLFLALPDEALDGLSHRLDFVVTENFSVTLKERLAFTSPTDAGAGRPVIEILPLHPNELARLRTGGNNDTSLSVYLDGNLIENDTLSELIKRSQELQQQDLFPVDVRAWPGEGGRSGRLSPSLAKLTPWGCVHECFQRKLSCESVCLRFPSLNCEERCESRYFTCLQNCGCPVVISEWTVTTVESDTPGPLPLVCLSNRQFYRRYIRRERTEHWQEIMQCDGVNVRVIAFVTYADKNCYRWVSQQGSCTPNPNLPPIELLCII